MIEQLLERVQDAWNRADLSAYAACYAEDASYLNRSGTLVVGRDEIEKLHRTAFEETLKGSHLRASIRRAVWLSETIAVVHVDVELSGPAQLWAVSTFVVRDGLIVAAQTTEL